MKVYGWIKRDGKWYKIHINDYDIRSRPEICDSLGRLLSAKTKGESRRPHYALKYESTQYVCEDKTNMGQ